MNQNVSMGSNIEQYLNSAAHLAIVNFTLFYKVDTSDTSDEEKEPERQPFLQDKKSSIITHSEEKKDRHQSEGNA